MKKVVIIVMGALSIACIIFFTYTLALTSYNSTAGARAQARERRAGATREQPAALPSGAEAADSAAPASDPVVYKIRDGEVVFPEWDADVASARPELARVSIEQFEPPAFLFRERLILTTGTVRTAPLTIPAGASELVLNLRAIPQEDIFPRVQVLLRPVAADDGEAPAHLLGQVTVQTRYWEAFVLPLPRGIEPGSSARLELRLLNPLHVHDRVMLYYSHAYFR